MTSGLDGCTTTRSERTTRNDNNTAHGSSPLCPAQFAVFFFPQLVPCESLGDGSHLKGSESRQCHPRGRKVGRGTCQWTCRAAMNDITLSPPFSFLFLARVTIRRVTKSSTRRRRERKKKGREEKKGGRRNVTVATAALWRSSRRPRVLRFFSLFLFTRCRERGLETEEDGRKRAVLPASQSTKTKGSACRTIDLQSGAAAQSEGRPSLSARRSCGEKTTENEEEQRGRKKGENTCIFKNRRRHRKEGRGVDVSHVGSSTVTLG